MPLNVQYRRQTIGIGAKAEPLHTWLKDIFRDLLFEKTVKVMGQSHQTIVIGATAERLHTWLKDIFRDPLFEKTVKVKGQSEASHNSL